MITHVVLLSPRSDLTSAERDRFVEAFREAVTMVPQVRSVRVGRRVTHGAGYEAGAPALAFLALIDFDDVAALQAYLRHPAHAQLGELFGSVVSSVLVLDYEVGGIDRLAQIAGITPGDRAV